MLLHLSGPLTSHSALFFSSKHHPLHKQYIDPSNPHFDRMDVDEKQVFKMIEFKHNAETRQDSKR